MKIRVYSFLIFAVSAFALATLLTTLFNATPSDTPSVLLFFACLYLVITGLLFFVFFINSYARTKIALSTNDFLRMLKQSLLYALATICLVALKSFGLISLPIAIIILLIVIIVDLITRGIRVK